MSEIKTVTRWNGMLVDQYTDTSTGQIEIRSAGAIIGTGIKGDLLAISTGRYWKIVDANGFRRRYNNAQTNEGRATVTEQEFEREFNNNGVPTFNNDRAAVLNNPDNYASIEISEGNRAAFVQKNIPLVKDPRSGLMVSSNGVKQTLPTTAPQPDPLVTQPAKPQSGETAELDTEFDEDYTAARRNRGGKGETLRYPIEPDGPFQYDYISIQAADYKPSGLNTNNEVYSGEANIGPRYETIVLPMQPTLTETNAVNWSDDQLNAVQMMFGKAAMSAIKTLGGTTINNLGELPGKIGKHIQDLGYDIKQAVGDPLTKQWVAAYFAGQAVGSNLVGRTSGMVINPNLELLFNGPNLRSFNFNFRLTPRSEEESEECRKIIYAFKRNMAASRSDSNLFLTSPRIFILKYIYKDSTPHPYLNKFKPCAMTNFSVNYTPDGSYATFDKTGSMTQFEIDMSFTEIKPIYAEDNPAETPQTTGF